MINDSKELDMPPTAQQATPELWFPFHAIHSKQKIIDEG